MSATSEKKVLIDLNDLAGGKVELGTFPAKVSSLDLTSYTDKHVQLSGCAPTWAHLLVAARLFPVVSGLDFLVDDGKEGKVVEVLKRG